MNSTLKFCRLLLTGAVVFFFANVFGSVRHIVDGTSSGASDTLAVWVSFTAKEEIDNTGNAGTPLSLARRRAVGYIQKNGQDAPVASTYIRSIEALGGKLRQQFTWGNAASFNLSATALPLVKRLPFVGDVSLVGRFHRNVGPVGSAKRRASTGVEIYGPAFEQLNMLEITGAHRYLRYRYPGQAPGHGVRVAFFDSGFRLDHRCFQYLYERGGIKGMRDFIDDDSTVTDPDSVRRNPAHPYWTNDNHGTQVLACALAYDPPRYCGAAWGAEVVLARTEDTYTDTISGVEHELHTEEDNWAAAVVWAESLGVDIISSSLGYRYDFQDTVIIRRVDGTVDTVVDYLKSDLDGATTIVSKAAKGAIERGVIIVNAAGNEQDDGEMSIGAPADVDGLIAVGSVNNDGSLSYFSSLGPSADGRIKPDIVAPGHRIAVPSVDGSKSADYSGVISGTSFATPLAAGVCMLIKQAFPGAPAGEVRERLYRYCRLPAGMAAPDNRYGRGIPDALRSCMQRDDEVFFFASDTGGLPLVNALILTAGGDTLGRTDAAGISLFYTTLPMQLSVSRNARQRQFRVNALPYGMEMTPCSLVVSVRDESGTLLMGAAVRLKIDGDESVLLTDSAGIAVAERFFPADVRYTVSHVGFVRSDTLRALLGERRTSAAVTLKSTGSPVFEVYPTVVRRSRGSKLVVLYRNPAGLREAHPATVTVRSVGGSVVWRQTVNMSGVPITMEWDGKCPDGRRASPGTYFLLLTNMSLRYRTKFIIAE